MATPSWTSRLIQASFMACAFWGNGQARYRFRRARHLQCPTYRITFSQTFFPTTMTSEATP